MSKWNKIPTVTLILILSLGYFSIEPVEPMGVPDVRRVPGRVMSYLKPNVDGIDFDDPDHWYDDSYSDHRARHRDDYNIERQALLKESNGKRGEFSEISKESLGNIATCINYDSNSNDKAKIAA